MVLRRARDQARASSLAQPVAVATGDASSIEGSLDLAETNLEKARVDHDDRDDDEDDDDPTGSRTIREVTADKGYHKASTIHSLEKKRIRTLSA